MPNCDDTKYKCGIACTDEDINRAYYKDCNTGRIGTGATYTEAKQSATQTRPKCANLTGATFEACKNGIKVTKRKDPIRFINPLGKPVKQIEREIREGITPAHGGITPSHGGITPAIPRGSRFDQIENNWKDTEVLLGDPEPDDDPTTVGDRTEEACYGLPIPCGSLAVGVGAVLLLIMSLRFLR